MFNIIVILKPDAVRRRLSVKIMPLIFNKFSQELKSEKLKMNKNISLQPTIEMARKHYDEHKTKDHFNRITNGLASGPVDVYHFITPDENILYKLREYATGEIRDNFVLYNAPRHENVIHCSDSPDAGNREKEIWFA